MGSFSPRLEDAHTDARWLLRLRPNLDPRSVVQVVGVGSGTRPLRSKSYACNSKWGDHGPTQFLCLGFLIDTVEMTKKKKNTFWSFMVAQQVVSCIVTAAAWGHCCGTCWYRPQAWPKQTNRQDNKENPFQVFSWQRLMSRHQRFLFTFMNHCIVKEK